MGDVGMSESTNHSSTTPQNGWKWAKKHMVWVGVVAIVLILTISYTTFSTLMPVRSVANFCKAYTENKSVLVNGNSNYQTIVDAYSKLESVAPSDIEPDVKRIKNGYQTAIDDPSKTLGVGFGIMGEINRLNDYKTKNCSTK